MKNIKKLVALTTLMALCASQVQSQDFDGPYQGNNGGPRYAAAPPAAVYEGEPGPAYEDGSSGVVDNQLLWGAGAVVVVGVVIWLATRNHHHHHHSSSSSSSSSSRSSSSSSSFSHN